LSAGRERVLAATRRAWASFRADASALEPSERICDWLVLGLAAWTLVCNAVVFLSGDLHALLGASLGAGLLLAAGGLLLRRLGGQMIGSARPADAPPAPAGQRPRAVVLVGGLAVALALAAGALATRDVQLLWALCVVYFAAALGLCWPRRDESGGSPIRSAPWERALWTLAAGAALLPLLAHRRSLDDAGYVNFAVGAIDFPELPLLHFDTLHGIPGMPIILPVYQSTSYELLGAVVAVVSGLSAIQAMHWILPAVFGPFVVLAYARLMRQLSPDAWIWSLAAALAILVFVAEGTEFYGNFSFLRLQQGKCVFLSVLAPLLIVYSVRFADAPSLRRWTLLGAAQIAAMGLTSTAIWVGPALVGLGLASRVAPSLQGVRTLALGLAASAYVLAVGLALRGGSGAAVEGFGEFETVAELFAFSWRYMLGSGAVAFASLVAVLCAWVFCRDPISRRICIVLPLGVLLFLLNPHVALLLAENVTGPPTFYRVLWVLPIPAFLALVLTAPLGLEHPRAPFAARLGLSALATAAFVVLAPELHALSPRNYVRWEPLGLKVPPAEYRVAEQLSARVPQGSWILAPEPVSLWVGTIHRHPYALVSRIHYLKILRAHYEPAEWQLRIALTQYVGGRWHSPQGPALLARGIEHFDLAGVSLLSALPWAGEIRRVLRDHGFQPSYSDGRYEVWTRPA
jgi:hypothetical protein